MCMERLPAIDQIFLIDVSKPSCLEFIKLKCLFLMCCYRVQRKVDLQGEFLTILVFDFWLIFGYFFDRN